jgi:diguanylate cyclase (GGDEF)-like protein
MPVDGRTRTMHSAPVPGNERERIRQLHALEILDTPSEQAYDDLATLAARICGTSTAFISLVDSDRQWFKAHIGTDVRETPRDVAFCAHAILRPGELFVIEDALQDERFTDNPFVIEPPHLRFYAGAPLVTKTGEALGTICVVDTKPRHLDAGQREALAALSRQVVAQMELRSTVKQLREHLAARTAYEEELRDFQRRLEEMNARLTRDSETDGLTGLRNRRAFDRTLDAEVSRARRHCMPLSLVMLDLDHFKAYNDAFGHLAGDDALRRVARLLEAVGRSEDIVARYGGEEFALILPNTDGIGANEVAERVRRAVEIDDRMKRPLTMSAGVATLVTEMEQSENLVAAADAALYASKSAGRNRVTVAGAGAGAAA